MGNSEKKTRVSGGWILMTVAVSLLILYTVYHVFFGLAQGVETTYAGLIEDGRAVVLEGVIFRDEAPLKTEYRGELYPYLYDGERASASSVVGEIYSKSAGGDVARELAELEEKLDILKKSNVRGLISISDVEKLNKEADELYSQYMLALSKGEIYRASALEREYLIAINKLKICRGEVKNYDAEISELEAEAQALYNSLGGEMEYVIAEKSAYFYHSCDGYEEILTNSALEQMSASELSELVGKVKQEPKRESEYKCKFVYDHTWRIAAICESDAAELLEVGRAYTVTLYDFRERELSFVLESASEAQEGKVKLVFSCSEMPEGFEYSRYQSFRIDVSSVKGYRVPKGAVVSVDGLMGVYVLQGSEVRFKRVTVLSEGKGYYVCAEQSTHGEPQSYLAQNAQIILDPDGMYDGRILSR